MNARLMSQYIEFVADRWLSELGYEKNSNLRHRPIGIGVQGLADAFILLRMPFESDVTERKKQIIAIQKQNEQLKEIAWTQSHIVRAPLARMMGIINLFDEGIIQDLEVEEFLNYIKQSGTELDEIIKDIVKKTERVDNDYVRMNRETSL